MEFGRGYLARGKGDQVMAYRPDGTITHRDRLRRRPGRCEDCGIPGQMVREIRFWLNGMSYIVCADHEKEYTRGGNAWVVEKGYEHA